MKLSVDEPVSVDLRDGAIHLDGALTLENATAALAAAGAQIDNGDERVVFDLAGLWRADSAALAVLLELRRRAIRQGRELAYRNAPERLRQLARISEVESVLGFEGQD